MNRIGIFRALSGLGLREPNVLHPASVLKQHTDGRIDVRCDESALGDWSRVKIWGFPNTKVLVQPKTRVLVGFAGVLRQPFAVAFSGTGLVGLEIGSNPVGAARKGDAVRIDVPVGAITVMTPNGPGSNTMPLTLSGEIVEGSSVVKIQ